MSSALLSTFRFRARPALPTWRKWLGVHRRTLRFSFRVGHARFVLNW